MKNITKKDIQSFGKVLAEIGEVLTERPDLLISFFANQAKKNINNTSKNSIDNINVSEKASSFNLFEDLKGKSKDEIFEILSTFSKEDLNYFIKKFNLGYTRYKASETIADYIADKVSKRNTDVFINQK
ncbi:hypothetical protein [Pantoea agglomerans]|uniref:hypothetical protein n=1 Tax=Enterobacter agglomerans TaxID=549 RepID=UPI002A69D42E|nr:hypothetical protein [Pantoea agglomerans]MDY0900078.1 hypothetical protein [Pantoea agglomerans]